MKSRIFLLLSILVAASDCATSKTNSIPIHPQASVKLTLLYPSGEGKTFNWEYYTHTHYPLLKKYFGNSMKAFQLDQGESSGIPNTPVPYVAIAYFYFDNVEAFQDVMKTNGAEIMADIPKYTNIAPVVQISRVVQQDNLMIRE